MQSVCACFLLHINHPPLCRKLARVNCLRLWRSVPPLACVIRVDDVSFTIPGSGTSTTATDFLRTRTIWAITYMTTAPRERERDGTANIL